MSFAARTVVDKLCVCIPPVVAFVACGFEHCVANMYFLPLGLLAKSALPADALTGLNGAEGLTLAASAQNILFSTLGNLVGGIILVACMYWFIYLRKAAK